MTTLNGIGIVPGRIVAPVLHMPPAVQEPPAGKERTSAISADEAKNRLKEAMERVSAGIAVRAEAAASAGRKDSQAVLTATSLMAKDAMLFKNAGQRIVDGNLTAERAIWEAAEDTARQFQELGSYMAERASDVLDVRLRIIAELRGEKSPGIPESDTPFILVAEDLAPADTATIDPAIVRGIITHQGGPQSHTAILARSLGIIAVVAVANAEKIEENTATYIDGASGFIGYPATKEDERRAVAWQNAADKMQVFNGDCRLKDGHKIPLLANIGNPHDAEVAAGVKAEGIGLLRTEFLFLGRAIDPSLDEQIELYTDIFETFSGKKVVIRTLDAGADKPLPFVTDGDEKNPALGIRGYRTQNNHPAVLRRQLEAISLAQKAAKINTGLPTDVWVMAPMISTPEESDAFAELCYEYDIKTPGIMIEVPSAAVDAERLLKKATFASLGTNDLTQYAMAADRELSSLASLNDPWQPAVLRLIALAAEGTRKAAQRYGSGRSIGVCGEAASDPALAVVLIGLGIQTLSMTPRAFDAVSMVLSSVDLPQAQEIAQLALSIRTASEAKAAVRARLPLIEDLGL